MVARIQLGRLHRIHRGVYAVGHRRVSRQAWWLAAVLACGREAVLSHRSAAALWGMRERSPTTVEVSVPRRIPAGDGIHARQAKIAVDERTVHAGIPVTTVPRTLLDLAAVLQEHELSRALEEAEIRSLSDPTPLVAVAERHKGRRGVAKLRRALPQRAGLPRPLTNQWLDADLQVDCVWPEQRLIVELDGRAYHDTGAAFERDRQRDRRLQAAGWRVVRVTDQAMRTEGRTLRSDLRALLSRPAAPARSA